MKFIDCRHCTSTFGKAAAIGFVSGNGYRLSKLPVELRGDIDVVFAAILNNPEAIRFSKSPARSHPGIRRAVWQLDKSALDLLPN